MKESQNKQILETLLKGNGISQQQAIKMYQCYRLSARIKNLRDKGHEIFCKMVEHGRSRFGLYFMRDSPLFESYGACYLGKN
jgi:hypothetical protein